MGDLLEEEPSLDVAPVTLLPVLFNHNVNQSINQSINKTVNHLSIGHTCSQSASKPVSESVCLSVYPSVRQSVSVHVGKNFIEMIFQLTLPLLELPLKMAHLRVSR